MANIYTLLKRKSKNKFGTDFSPKHNISESDLPPLPSQSTETPLPLPGYTNPAEEYSARNRQNPSGPQWASSQENLGTNRDNSSEAPRGSRRRRNSTPSARRKKTRNTEHRRDRRGSDALILERHDSFNPASSPRHRRPEPHYRNVNGPMGPDESNYPPLPPRGYAAQNDNQSVPYGRQISNYSGMNGNINPSVPFRITQQSQAMDSNNPSVPLSVTQQNQDRSRDSPSGPTNPSSNQPAAAPRVAQIGHYPPVSQQAFGHTAQQGPHISQRGQFRSEAQEVQPMPSPHGTQDIRYLPRVHDQPAGQSPTEFSHSSRTPSGPHSHGVSQHQMDPQNMPIARNYPSEPQGPISKPGPQINQQRTQNLPGPPRSGAPDSNYPMESHQSHRLGYQGASHGPQIGYQLQNQDNQSISSSVQTQDSQESQFQVSHRMPYPSEPQGRRYPPDPQNIQPPMYQQDPHFSERTQNQTEPSGAQQRGYPSEPPNSQAPRYHHDPHNSERTQNLTDPPGAQQRGYSGPQHLPGTRLQDNQRTHGQYPQEPPRNVAPRHPSGIDGIQVPRQLPGQHDSARGGNPQVPQGSQPSWSYQPNIPPVPQRVNNAANQHQLVLHLGEIFFQI